MPDDTKTALRPAMLRGLRGRCPHCGEGPLFYRYLKVSPACACCAHDLDAYPADDGPAYFTILLVGHLVVAPLFFFSLMWRAPVAVVVPMTLIPLFVLTLVVLPRVKGAVIGLLYANGVSRHDAHIHTADRY
ncbi:MAG: DUF983 domain-containing protein [Caulobacteraceae bacterium]|nr:DUF983 domain-containing protein [Caulobacteraceae bacterium]